MTLLIWVYFQSEYIADYDSKRAFISGFTGSAGTVIVTPDEALLWTDGRYYLQASNQLDNNWQLMKECNVFFLFKICLCK